MATLHYPIGGSTIEITGLCPGSVEARKGYKNAPAGEPAERGTRIHQYCEIIWKQTYQGYTPTKKDKNFIKRLSDDERKIGVALTEAMKETVINLGFTPEEIIMEKQYAYRGEIAGGTPDGDAHRAFGDMFIGDYKTGFVQVDAEQNIQEMFYAACKLRNLDAFEAETIENIHLVILQPVQPDSPLIQVKHWAISRQELKSWEETFDMWIDRALANPDLRIAGEHCVNCPAAAKCKEYTRYANEQTKDKVSLIEGGYEPWIGDGKELAQMYRELPIIRGYAKALNKYCEKVEAEVKNQLNHAPDAVPSLMLETSFGNRVFPDEKAVAKKAKELGISSAEIRTSSLISPNQMEILCKMKKVDHTWVNELAVKPATGLKIVEGQAKSIEDIFASV